MSSAGKASSGFASVARNVPRSYTVVTMVTKTVIVRIGNSRGIRIPKSLLDEAELPEEVELHAGWSFKPLVGHVAAGPLPQRVRARVEMIAYSTIDRHYVRS